MKFLLKGLMMMKRFIFCIVFCCVVTNYAFAEKVNKKTQSKKSVDEYYQVEKNIVYYTNNERVKRGLRPLVINKKLVDSSRKHCNWMANVRRLQHSRIGVAENIAMGYRNSKEVVRGWMNSKGHRANLLNSRHRKIGVSAYKSKDGRIWWCQQFSR